MRCKGWEWRLFDAVVAATLLRFEWGKHDCVTFAADMIETMTGRDPIWDLRGMWRDERSAAAWLRELGGLQAGVTDRLGPPLESPQLAGRGDLVLTDQGNLAVVVLNYAVALSKEGLQRYEPQRWTAGWRVV